MILQSMDSKASLRCSLLPEKRFQFNGKCRQEENIRATELALSNHSTHTTSTKCFISMSKSTTITSRGQAALLPHRKVFMITEKSGENDEQHGPTDAANARRKRKMILIMDEKPQTDAVGTIQRPNGTKHMKTENEHAVKSTTSNNVAPKLLFFANSVDDQLSQKIEEILPEILSRIQWKNGRDIDGNESNCNNSKQHEEIQCDNDNGNISSAKRHTKDATKTCETQQLIQGHEKYSSDGSNTELVTGTLKISDHASHHSNNSNLMLLGAAAAATVANHTTESMRRITLPPKKNHIKFQRQLNNNNAGEQIISAATPVIVSATSLNKANNQVSAIRSSTDNSRNININNSHSQQQSNKINQLNGNSQLQHQHQHQQHHQKLHHRNGNQDDKNHNHYNNSNSNNNNDNKTTNGEKSSIVVQQQNINLSGDFLFLMKMLPILEKTPEPRKSQVKILIEKIMKQCVAGDNLQ